LMYLERRHPLSTYTKREDVASVRIEEYRPGTIGEWLKFLEKKGGQ